MDLHAHLDIAASAATVWYLIGERFGDIGQWAVPITSSSLDGVPTVGAVRQCHVAGFGPVPPGVIHEQLTVFEPDAMRFQYVAVQGMPATIKHATNRWQVVSTGPQSCVVRIHATMTMRGLAALAAPLMKGRMVNDSMLVLEELKHCAEHGRPHPRKVAAQERLSGGRI